jgi:hypothetical protein
VVASVATDDACESRTSLRVLHAWLRRTVEQRPLLCWADSLVCSPSALHALRDSQRVLRSHGDV